jgi:hypothetical protein
MAWVPARRDHLSQVITRPRYGQIADATTFFKFSYAKAMHTRQQCLVTDCIQHDACYFQEDALLTNRRKLLFQECFRDAMKLMASFGLRESLFISNVSFLGTVITPEHHSTHLLGPWRPLPNTHLNVRLGLSHFAI